MIIIYDPNSLNPYGGELARVLSQRYSNVLLYSANSGAKYYSESRLISGSMPAGRWLQVIWMLRRFLDPLRFAARALRSNGSVCVVVWIRDPWHALVTLVVCQFRPVLIIDHNPPGSRSSGRQSGAIISKLRSCVHALPVHGEELVTDNAPVVVHPSYLGMVNSVAASVSILRNDAYLRLVYVGALRPDKGAESLVQICSLIERPCQLTLIGTSELPPSLMSIDGRVRFRLIGGPVSDETLVNELKNSDLMIAPYVQPTQSGSLILALTVGLPAIAYEGGALGALLSPAALVERGDVVHLSQLVDIFAVGANSFWIATSEDLDSRCLSSWDSVLSVFGDLNSRSQP